MDEEKNFDNESFLLRVKKEPELLELDEIEEFLDTLEDLPLEFDEASGRRRYICDSDDSVVEISSDDDEDDDDDDYENDHDDYDNDHDKTVTAGTSCDVDSNKDCDKVIDVNKAVCNDVKSVSVNKECNSARSNKTGKSSNTVDDNCNKSENKTDNRKDKKHDADNKTKRVGGSKSGDKKDNKSITDHKTVIESITRSSDKQNDSKTKIGNNDENKRHKKTTNTDKNASINTNSKSIDRNNDISKKSGIKTDENTKQNDSKTRIDNNDENKKHKKTANNDKISSSDTNKKIIDRNNDPKKSEIKTDEKTKQNDSKTKTDSNDKDKRHKKTANNDKTSSSDSNTKIIDRNNDIPNKSEIKTDKKTKQNDSKPKTDSNDENKRHKKTVNNDKISSSDSNTKIIDKNNDISKKFEMKTDEETVNKTEIINKKPSETEQQSLPEKDKNKNASCLYSAVNNTSENITDQLVQGNSICNQESVNKNLTAVKPSAPKTVKMNCKSYVSRDPRLRKMNENLRRNSIELTNNPCGAAVSIPTDDSRLPPETGNDPILRVSQDAGCVSHHPHQTLPYSLTSDNSVINCDGHLNSSGFTEIDPRLNVQNYLGNVSDGSGINTDTVSFSTQDVTERDPRLNVQNYVGNVVNAYNSNVSDDSRINTDTVSSSTLDVSNSTDSVTKLEGASIENDGSKQTEPTLMEIPAVESTSQLQNAEPVKSSLINTVVTNSGDLIHINDLRRKPNKTTAEEGECTDSDDDSKYAKYETKSSISLDQVLWTRRQTLSDTPKADSSFVPIDINMIRDILSSVSAVQTKLPEVKNNTDDQVDFKKAIMEEVKIQMSLQLSKNNKEIGLNSTVPPLVLNTNDDCVDDKTKNNCTVPSLSPSLLDNLFKNADVMTKGKEELVVNKELKMSHNKESIKYEIEKCKDVDSNIEKSIKVLKQKGEFLDKKLAKMLANTKKNQDQKIKFYMDKKIENLKKLHDQVAKQINNKTFEQRRQEHYVNIHEETVKNLKTEDSCASKHVANENWNLEPDKVYQKKFKRIKCFEIGCEPVRSYEERLKIHEEKVKLIIALNKKSSDTCDDTNENCDLLFFKNTESDISDCLSTNKHVVETCNENNQNMKMISAESVSKLKHSLIKSTLEEISGRKLLDCDEMEKNKTANEKLSQVITPAIECFNGGSFDMDNDKTNHDCASSDMSIDDDDNDELFPTLSSIMRRESHETTKELIKELILPVGIPPEQVPEVSKAVPTPPPPPVISVASPIKGDMEKYPEVSLRDKLLCDIKRRKLSTESFLSTDSTQSKHRLKTLDESDIENDKRSFRKEKQHRKSNSPHSSRESRKKRLISLGFNKIKDLQDELYSKKKKLLKLMSSSSTNNKKCDSLLEKIIKCEDKLKKEEKKISKKKRKRNSSSPSCRDVRRRIKNREKEYSKTTRKRSRSRSPVHRMKSLVVYGRNPSPDSKSNIQLMKRERLKSENEKAVKRLKEITELKEPLNKKSRIKHTDTTEFYRNRTSLVFGTPEYDFMSLESFNATKAAVTELVNDFSAAPITPRTQRESHPVGKAREDQKNIPRVAAALRLPEKRPLWIPLPPGSPLPPVPLSTPLTVPSQSTIPSPSIQSVQNVMLPRVSPTCLPLVSPINPGSCLNSTTASQACHTEISKDTSSIEPSIPTVNSQITCRVNRLPLTITKHTGVDVLEEPSSYSQTSPSGNCSPIVSSEDSCMSFPSPILNAESIDKKDETKETESHIQSPSFDRTVNASSPLSSSSAVTDSGFNTNKTLPPPPASPSTDVTKNSASEEEDLTVITTYYSFLPVQNQYPINSASSGNMLLDSQHRVPDLNCNVITEPMQPPGYNQQSILGEYPHPPPPYKIVYHPRFPYPITVPIRNPVQPRTFQPVQQYPLRVPGLSTLLPQPINNRFQDLSTKKPKKRTQNSEGNGSKKQLRLSSAESNTSMDSSGDDSETIEMPGIPGEDDLDSLPGLKMKLPNEDQVERHNKCLISVKEIVPVTSSAIQIEDKISLENKNVEHTLKSLQCVAKEEDINDLVKTGTGKGVLLSLDNVKCEEFSSIDKFKYLVVKHNPKLLKCKKLSLGKKIFVKLIKYFDSYELALDNISNNECNIKDSMNLDNFNSTLINEDFKHSLTSTIKTDNSNENDPIKTKQQNNTEISSENAILNNTLINEDFKHSLTSAIKIDDSNEKNSIETDRQTDKEVTCKNEIVNNIVINEDSKHCLTSVIKIDDSDENNLIKTERQKNEELTCNNEIVINEDSKHCLTSIIKIDDSDENNLIKTERQKNEEFTCNNEIVINEDSKHCLTSIIKIDDSNEYNSIKTDRQYNQGATSNSGILTEDVCIKSKIPEVIETAVNTKDMHDSQTSDMTEMQSTNEVVPNSSKKINKVEEVHGSKLCATVTEGDTTKDETLKLDTGIMNDSNLSNEKHMEALAQGEISFMKNLESDKVSINCAHAGISETVLVQDGSILITDKDNNETPVCSGNDIIAGNNKLFDNTGQLHKSSKFVADVSKNRRFNCESDLNRRSFKICIPKIKINVNDIMIPAHDKILLSTFGEENTLPELIVESSLLKHDVSDVVNTKLKNASPVSNTNKRHLKDLQNMNVEPRLKYQKFSANIEDITNSDDNACYISMADHGTDASSQNEVVKLSSDSANLQNKICRSDECKETTVKCLVPHSEVQSGIKSSSGPNKTSEKVVCSEVSNKQSINILPKRSGRKLKNGKKKSVLLNESHSNEDSTTSSISITKTVAINLHNTDGKTKAIRDIFGDQDSSNGSAASFTRLILDICGSLEGSESQQSDDKSQAVAAASPDIFAKRLNIDETVISTVKILNSFKPISKKVYKTRKKVMFSNSNYDNVHIIPNTNEFKKSICGKKKSLPNKTNLTNIIDSLKSFNKENCDDTSLAAKIINEKASDMNLGVVTHMEKLPKENLVVMNSLETVIGSKGCTSDLMGRPVEDVISSPKNIFKVIESVILNEDEGAVITNESNNSNSVNAEQSCDLVSTNIIKVSNGVKNSDNTISDVLDKSKVHRKEGDIASELVKEDVCPEISDPEEENLPLSLIKQKISDVSLSIYDTTDSSEFKEVMCSSYKNSDSEDVTICVLKQNKPDLILSSCDTTNDSEFTFSDKTKCNKSGKDNVKEISTELNFKAGNFPRCKSASVDFENSVCSSDSQKDHEDRSCDFVTQDILKNKTVSSLLNTNVFNTSSNTNDYNSVIGYCKSNSGSVYKDACSSDESKIKVLRSSATCSDHSEDTSDSITTRLRNKKKVAPIVKTSRKPASDNPCVQLRKRLRSSALDRIKSTEKTENGLLLDMWERISSTVNSAQRTIGTHVTTVNNVLVGFEKTEPVKCSLLKNCDSNVSVDDVIDMLQRIKSIQNNHNT